MNEYTITISSTLKIKAENFTDITIQKIKEKLTEDNLTIENVHKEKI